MLCSSCRQRSSAAFTLPLLGCSTYSQTLSAYQGTLAQGLAGQQLQPKFRRFKGLASLLRAWLAVIFVAKTAALP